MDSWEPIDRSKRKSAFEIMMETQGLDSTVLQNPVSSPTSSVKKAPSGPIQLPTVPMRRGELHLGQGIDRHRWHQLWLLFEGG